MIRPRLFKAGCFLIAVFLARGASAGSSLIQTSIAPAQILVANPTSVFGAATDTSFFAAFSDLQTIVPISSAGAPGTSISTAPVSPFRCQQSDDDEIFCTGTRLSGNTMISTISRERSGVVTFYDLPDPEAFTGSSANVDIVVSDDLGVIVTIDMSALSLDVLSIDTGAFSQVPLPGGVPAFSFARSYDGRILVPYIGTNEIAVFDGLGLTPFTVPPAPGHTASTVDAAASCGSDVCVVDSEGAGLSRCDSGFTACTFTAAPAASSCFHAVRLGCGGRGAFCVVSDAACQALHEFDFGPGVTPTASTVSNPLGQTPNAFLIKQVNGAPIGLFFGTSSNPAASSAFLFSLPALNGPDLIVNTLEDDSLFDGKRSITVKVKNIGTKPANNVRVEIDLGGLDFHGFKNVDSVFFGSHLAGNVLTLNGIAPLPQGVAVSGTINFLAPAGATTDFTVNASVTCNNDADLLNNFAQPLDVPGLPPALSGASALAVATVTGR